MAEIVVVIILDTSEICSYIKVPKQERKKGKGQHIMFQYADVTSKMLRDITCWQE